MVHRLCDLRWLGLFPGKELPKMLTVIQWLILIIVVVSFGCFIFVAIPIFRQSVGLGILYVIVAIVTLGIGALVWGWVKAKEYDLQKVVTIWTICVVLNLILGTATITAAGNEMRKTFQESTERLGGQP